MSTRAAAASSSLRATQNLLKVLFGRRDGVYVAAEHSSYSYDELRTAFLKRAQELHPDKSAHLVEPELQTQQTKSYVELQNAWKTYEKHFRGRSGLGVKQSDFTLFGVGCSFADNDTEKQLRDDITDQACRGWFSSGEIGESAQDQTQDSDEKQFVSLVDESDFIAAEELRPSSTQDKVGLQKTLLDGSLRRNP